MNSQLLIVKIQSLLNGKTVPTESEIKSLCDEYNAIRNACADRLERCVALIRSNRDYLALQIAESEPPVLDTINLLEFKGLPEWRALCGEFNAECAPDFDGYYVELLQSLYTKDIGQNHPLYRDYRRAMRSRNYDDALKIIKTISRINSNNNDIKAEYVRLLKSRVSEKLAKIKTALQNNDTEQALKLFAFLEANSSEFDTDSDNWREICKKIDAIKLQNAKENARNILSQIKSIDISKDWRAAISLYNELKLIAFEYPDIVSQSDFGNAEVLKDKAFALRDEHAKTELSAKAKTAALLAFESDSKKGKSLAQSLADFTELQNKYGKYFDENSAKKVSQKIAAIKHALKVKKLVKLGFATCVVAAIAACAILCFNLSRKSERANAAMSEVAKFETLPSISEMKNSLAYFDKQYSEFAPKFEREIANAKNTLQMLESRKAKIEKSLETLDSIKPDTIDSNTFKAANAEFAALEESAQKLPKEDESEISEKIQAGKRRFYILIDTVKSSFEKEFSLASNEIENCISAFSSDYGQSFENSVNELGKKVQILKNLVEKYSRIVPLHPLNQTKYNDYISKYTAYTMRLQDIKNAQNAINNARSLDEFYSALTQLSAINPLPERFAKSIKNAQAQKESLIYGDLTELIGKRAFKSASKEFSFAKIAPLNEWEQLYDVYEYTDKDGKKIYTSKVLKERTNEWPGGYEVIQTGRQFSQDGTLRHIMRRKLVSGAYVKVNELLTGKTPAKESQFLTELARKRPTLPEALAEVAKADINCVFKAYLEYSLFTAQNTDEISSGIAYSKSALNRKQLILEKAAEFSPFSWIYANSAKVDDIKAALYSEKQPNYIKEATETKNLAKSMLENPKVFVGYVDELSTAHFFGENSGKIFGISAATSKVVVVYENGKLLEKPAIFSPLLKAHK